MFIEWYFMLVIWKKNVFYFHSSIQPIPLIRICCSHAIYIRYIYFCVIIRFLCVWAVRFSLARSGAIVQCAFAVCRVACSKYCVLPARYLGAFEWVYAQRIQNRTFKAEHHSIYVQKCSLFFFFCNHKQSMLLYLEMCKIVFHCNIIIQTSIISFQRIQTKLDAM